MRNLFVLLSLIAAPATAQSIQFMPNLGTQFRYEQYAADRLLGANDAFLFRAQPGFLLSSGAWSFDATSDAALELRRTETSATAGRMPIRPDAIQLDEVKVQYRGLPRTAISVGRQHLGMAGASLTGDLDGDQTFDAARLQWTGFAGLSADVAYAWSSSSRWAADTGPLPISVPGENVFAQINWANALGTVSGYAYQVDQREARNSDFRLLNQVYGARFTGSRRIGEDVKLAYSMGYVRQTGSAANAVGAIPTYWQVGNRFDLGDLSATQTNYRRFAGNGITTLNGDTISLATSATRGKVTVGATYNDFRPVPDAGGTISNRNIRVSLGLIF